MKNIRWGIYGPGRIANRFAEAMEAVPNSTIQAVAGRTYSRTKDFAARHNIPEVLPNITALSEHNDIDAVYIATTHNIHCHASCTMLQAGKAVLCEKPLAMNAKEVQLMISVSDNNKAFLMEALWTRFLPAWKRVRELLSENTIGRIKMLQGNFGITGQFDEDGRLLNKALAGGALLDLGIYPVAMAQMVFTSPITSVYATGELGSTGVDTLTAITLTSENNGFAQLSASLCAQTTNNFVISGTKGKIEITDPFWGASQIKWKVNGKDEKEESFPHRLNGFEEQIEEVNCCIRQGKQESDIMPHKDSLEIAQTLDEIRKQIGLRYPADDNPAETCGS